jgi:predicted metal-dependent enzyme (double-stranded beta helix superfamily)
LIWQSQHDDNSSTESGQRGRIMNRNATPPVDITRRNLLVAGTAAAVSGGLVLSHAAGADPKPFTPARKSALDIDRFVADCIEANGEGEPQAAVLEVLARAVHDPDRMLAAVGEPHEAGLKVLLRSKTLTIFGAAWTPQMNLMPHNHLMWANIGIHTGREDNLLWRRTDGSIEAFGARALFAGDVVALPEDVIHSVTNPLLRFTGGIHIYGGDFFDTTRSQWDPETLAENPSDGAAIRSMFERENERLRRRTSS